MNRNTSHNEFHVDYSLINHVILHGYRIYAQECFNNYGFGHSGNPDSVCRLEEGIQIDKVTASSE